MHLFYYTDSDSPCQFFLITSPNNFNSPLLVLADRLKKKTAVKYLLFFLFFGKNIHYCWGYEMPLWNQHAYKWGS